MQNLKHKSMKRIIAYFLLVAFAFMLPLSTMAYDLTTLYTPPVSAPDPGALYARAMQASDGSMYATFEQYTNGTPVFPIYKSTNNGQSWTQVGSVTDQVHGYGMRYQPFLYELPQQIGSLAAGTLLCAGNCIPNDLSSTEIDLYASTNSGVSWTYISTIATGGAANPDSYHDPVWEPFLLVANNKLICYYSDETDPDHNQKLVHKTTTNATSWSAAVEDVALANSSLRPGMPVIAQMENGNYIMTFEIIGLSGAPNHFKISSNPESWNAADDGTQFSSGGSPYVAVMDNGRIVAGSHGTSNVYVNNSNGTGAWYSVATKVPSAYTRCLVPLSNGRLFIISGGPFGGSDNTVTYADMDIGSMSATVLTLSSYNYPTYYVRHYNYEAVLNQSVSPAEDAQFRIVPGLADAGCISFESLNFPGYYLRHYDYALRVDQNDDSASFAQDATFTRVSGLAGAGYSYRSYNYPSRYIRHANFELSITAISTALDQQDATFYENSVS